MTSTAIYENISSSFRKEKRPFAHAVNLDSIKRSRHTQEQVTFQAMCSATAYSLPRLLVHPSNKQSKYPCYRLLLVSSWFSSSDSAASRTSAEGRGITSASGARKKNEGIKRKDIAHQQDQVFIDSGRCECAGMGMHTDHTTTKPCVSSFTWKASSRNTSLRV